MKQPKCPSTDEWIKCGIAIVEDCSSIKKNEVLTDKCYHTNEPWKYYAKWKKPDTKGHTL